MKHYDSIIQGGKVVLPEVVADRCDIGIKDGRISAVCEHLSPDSADRVFDAAGLTVMPGAVDSHFHLGIYRSLEDDIVSETKSALVGGVTSILSYFRTGAHYMNKSGPYHDIFPEVLKKTENKAFVDFGFHLSPMDKKQVQEMEWLVKECGVTTFKYFMFYKGLNLSASSTDSAALTMSDSYDLGHLYTIMENMVSLNKSLKDEPLSVSVHCEDDELIKVFIQKVNAAGVKGLKAYHEARPPLEERVAVLKAGTLAAATGAVLNILHIGSGEALQATRDLLKIYPEIKIRREATLHALGLSYDMLEGKGLGGKVNPPIRTKETSEALWQGVLNGEIDWIGSDHACTPESLKGNDLWPAACGFGGTALMYPYMISEGYHKRGLSLPRVAALVSANPAKAHALFPRKGGIFIGADADFALIDLNMEKTVTPDILHSAQEYSPFAGLPLKGWPVMTILRGHLMFKDNAIVEDARGQYLKRPLGF